SSIGSNREVASQAGTARLVPPADANALNEAILHLARDPAAMADLGNNARSVFEDHYTEGRMLAAYRQLYVDLLKQKSVYHETVNGSQPRIIEGQAATVREATVADLPGIVRIHQKAFSHFFLTRLGGEFLRLYYGLVLNYHAGIILVSEAQGTLLGFVCGFTE